MTPKVLLGVCIPFNVSRLPDVGGDLTIGVSALLLWGDDFTGGEDAFLQAKNIAQREGVAIPFSSV